MTTVFQAGNSALITGGASGVGLALTKKLLGYGVKVLVADWDDELLAALPENAGAGAATIKADVSKVEDWAKIKAKVDTDFGGKINLLVLNAGIGRPSSWEKPENFQAILDVNLYGVVHGITTCLPAVKAAAAAAAAAAAGSRAAVVITGSKQGITNPPGNPAYNASKAAVKTLAEHLSFDLRADPALSVHLLVPGWTFTGLSGNRPGAGKEKPAGAWWPEQVVDYLEQKMAEGKFYVLCPDNDVAEETDKKRMLWTAGDLVEGRPPLTRWRDEWKGKAQEWMDQQKF